jgi:hypothetical protein
MKVTSLNNAKIQKRLLNAKEFVCRLGESAFSSAAEVNVSGLSAEEIDYAQEVFLGCVQINDIIRINIVDNNSDVIVFSSRDIASESACLLIKSLQKKYIYHSFQHHGVSLPLQTNRINIVSISS